MTVSSTTRKAGPFSGNGSTTSFPFAFKIYTKNDIAVTLTDSTGAVTTLVLDSDYSVAVNTNQDTSPGGTVTYPISGSALPGGSTLTIIGSLAYSQTTQLPSGGAYNAQNVEAAFDKVTMLSQQLLEAQSRALTIPVSSTASATLPKATSLNLLGWNSTADALTNFDSSTLGISIANASWFTQLFSGTGSQTAFVLTTDPGVASSIDLCVSGVTQTADIDFTYNSTTKTITFVTAPPLGANNVVARYGTSLPIGSLSDNTVTPAKLVNNGYELGMRNRIINGAALIDQRNSGVAYTVPSTALAWTLDRWAAYSSASTKFSVQQISAFALAPPAGVQKCIEVASLSAYTISSLETFYLGQFIEGINTADLNWGKTNAATVTLSFYARSSLVGTFGGALQNQGQNKSYPFTYTISAANTWTQVSITIPGPTTGSWATDTTLSGIKLYFGLGVGGLYSGAPNAWADQNYYSATGSTSLVGTNGATLQLAHIQLEKGTTATPFDWRSYGTELALCQRYYYRQQATAINQEFATGWAATTTTANIFTTFPVQMRAQPTALEQSGTATQYQVTYAGGSATCSAVPTYLVASPWNAKTRFTVASGLTAGQGCSGVALATTAYLAWNAELT